MSTLGAGARFAAVLLKLAGVVAAVSAAQLGPHADGATAWLPWPSTAAACAFLLMAMAAAAAALWVAQQGQLQLHLLSESEQRPQQELQWEEERAGRGQGKEGAENVPAQGGGGDEELLDHLLPAASPAPEATAAAAVSLVVPLVDDDLGLISPFAAFMPLLDPISSENLDAPSTPELFPSPGPAPARQEHPQGLVGTHVQQRQQQQLGSEAPAVACCPVPMWPSRRLPSGVGGWLAALLGRGWSTPAEVGATARLPGAAEGGNCSEAAARQELLLGNPGPLQLPGAPPLTPLPIRRRDSQEGIHRYPSSSSGASAHSQATPRGRAAASALAAVGSLELLDSLSDWELSPEEIKIMKRPDGSDWELGSGGFGKVYKALRNGVQPVAVKVLREAGSDAREACMSDLRHEITILKACKDPNIVSFLGACLEEDATMLVTEYCERGSLTRNIMRGKVSWYQHGKKVALDVARGLVFLHSRRIVHFDLKSPNILLSRDGTAKIGDVGMAKIIGREFSAVTGSLGSLAWASPEMLLGARCTEKSDIYSFGVLLWEICTGETPMRGQLRDVRTSEECPAAVREIILDCLDPNPRVRPTAFQLVERLQEAPDVAPLAAPASGCRSVSQFRAYPRQQHHQPAGAAGSPRAAPAPRAGQAAGPLPLRAGSMQPVATRGTLAAAEGGPAFCPGLGRITFPDLGPVPTSTKGEVGTVAGVWGTAGNTHLRSPLPQQQQHQQQVRQWEECSMATQFGAAAVAAPLPPPPLARSSSFGDKKGVHTGRQRSHALSPPPLQPQQAGVVAAGAGLSQQQGLQLGLEAAAEVHNCPFYPLLAQQMRREHSSPAAMNELAHGPLHGPRRVPVEPLSMPSGSTAHSMEYSSQQLGLTSGCPTQLTKALSSTLQPGTPTAPWHSRPHAHMAQPRSEPLLTSPHSMHDVHCWHSLARSSSHEACATCSMAIPQRGPQQARQEASASMDEKVWGRLLFNM